MPTVPTLDAPRVQPARVPGFQLGQTQQNVGGVAAQGLEGLSQILEQERLKADRTAVTAAETARESWANSALYDPDNGAFKREGANALGVTNDVLSDYDNQTKQISKGLRGQRQNEAFMQSSAQNRVALQGQLARYEFNERGKYEDQTANARISTAIDTGALNYNDPVSMRQSRDAITNTLKVQQTAHGWDDITLQNQSLNALSKLHTSVIDRMVTDGKFGDAKTYLDKSRGEMTAPEFGVSEHKVILGQKQAEDAAKSAAVKAQANSIIGIYGGDGPEAGAHALTALSKKLPPDVMNEVYSKVQENLNHARNAKQEEHADELAGIYQSIAAGTAGSDQMASVDKLWQDNAFTPTERASLIGRIESSQVEHAGNIAAANAVREALAKGLPLDPSNADHRKALSTAFAEDSRESPVGSPQWQGLAVAYATRTRVVPEQATSWVRSAIRSPDPNVAAPAAQFLGAIEANAGDAASGFDANTKAFAGMVNSMVEAGTPAEKAVETARANVYEQKPALIEQRKTEYRALAKDSGGALNNFIDRDMDPSWFSAQPAPTAALSVDFNSQAEKYYLKTGDMNLARELAWTDLKRVYGPSEVNGVKQVMAAPPERFGVRPEDIHADIGGFLAEHPQGDAKTEDILLVPDALTMRASADMMDGKPQSPTYKLINGKTGDLVLNARGVPVRYALPSGDDLTAKIKDEQAKAQEIARKQVEDARVLREQRRQRTEERIMGAPSMEWNP